MNMSTALTFEMHYNVRSMSLYCAHLDRTRSNIMSLLFFMYIHTFNLHKRYPLPPPPVKTACVPVWYLRAFASHVGGWRKYFSDSVESNRKDTK